MLTRLTQQHFLPLNDPFSSPAIDSDAAPGHNSGDVNPAFNCAVSTEEGTVIPDSTHLMSILCIPPTL